MRTVVAKLCEGIVGIGLSFTEVQYIDFRILFAELFVNAQSQVAGNFLTGTDRQFDRDTDASVVLCREEFCFDGRNQHHTSCEYQHGAEYNRFTMAYGPTQKACVSYIERIQCFLDRSEE